MLRVAFFGNGFDYSLAYLDVLVEAGVKLVAIVAPMKGGASNRRRSRRLAAQLAARLPETVRRSLPGTPREKFVVRVCEIAQQTGAALFWPESINDPCLVDDVAVLNPELTVMAGFDQILRPVVLEELSPIVNIHPSLLPDYRGPHPEFWVIANDEKVSGVTLHLVDGGIDTGPVVAQRRFDVEPWLSGGDLHERSMAVGRKLLLRLLDEWEGEATPRWPQEGEGSYFGKVSDGDLVVAFAQPARRVHALSRAVTPWGCVHTYVPKQWWEAGPRLNLTAAAGRTHGRDMVRLHLRQASLFEGHTLGTPGTVVRAETGGVAIACEGGTVYFASVEAVQAG